jgi:hypothetical protein
MCVNSDQCIHGGPAQMTRTGVLKPTAWVGGICSLALAQPFWSVLGWTCQSSPRHAPLHPGPPDLEGRPGLPAELLLAAAPEQRAGTATPQGAPVHHCISLAQALLL